MVKPHETLPSYPRRLIAGSVTFTAPDIAFGQGNTANGEEEYCYSSEKPGTDFECEPIDEIKAACDLIDGWEIVEECIAV